MKPEAIKFGRTYRIRESELLEIPACEVRVVERRGSDFFSVVLPNGQRETLHASILEPA
jgi:hypothetical protein